MPVCEYLEDLEAVGSGLAAAIRDSRPSRQIRGRRARASSFSLRNLIAESDPLITAIPRGELKVLFERLKQFAKRVHRSARQEGTQGASPGAAQRESSMPLEVAQVLYNLAGALALTRCDVRIIGLDDERYRSNLSWVLDQPWLDTKLRPVFLAALERLGASGGS